MTIKTRIITRNVKSVRCDKCGHKVNHFFSRICKSCYSDRLTNKRISDFMYRYCVIGSWQDHYDKCRLCGEYLGKQDGVELCNSCVRSLHPEQYRLDTHTGAARPGRLAVAAVRTWSGPCQAATLWYLWWSPNY